MWLSSCVMACAPEMPASSWPLPDAASSRGFQDSCLLPGCRAWAVAAWEGAPLHLYTTEWHLTQRGLKHARSVPSKSKILSFIVSKTCLAWMEAYVWVRPEGCRRRSASCGCRGNWAPPGGRWSPSCRSRCCPRSRRLGWCWCGTCWGDHRSPGRATRVRWRRSPWWCWALRTAAVWERCLEVGRVQNALLGQRNRRASCLRTNSQQNLYFLKDSAMNKCWERL